LLDTIATPRDLEEVIYGIFRYYILLYSLRSIVEQRRDMTVLLVSIGVTVIFALYIMTAIRELGKVTKILNDLEKEDDGKNYI
jgi:hypothetical protein